MKSTLINQSQINHAGASHKPSSTQSSSARTALAAEGFRVNSAGPGSAIDVTPHDGKKHGDSASAVPDTQIRNQPFITGAAK